MSTDTTLLAHIVPWLTDRIEDVAVEALAYILSNSPAARKALAETLKEGGTEVGPIDRVETWETGDEGEIPDLVCFDEKGVKRVLIEAKFWAALAKTQPNQYLKQLLEDKNGKSGALLFVAPRARLETLWPELCQRAKEEFELTDISKSDLVRSATIGSDCHHLQLTSWATLLERMESKANDAESDIGQLRGLTDRMDGDAFLPLGSEDLASESAQQMLDVAQLIDDATNHAKKLGWVDTEGLHAAPWPTGYGRYIQIGGVVIWFGINFSGWARHSNTPLWLSFGKGYREQLKQANLLDQVIWIKESAYLPIMLPDSENYYQILNAVVDRLGELAKRFDSSISKTADHIDSDFFRKWRQTETGPEFAKQMLGMKQIIDDAAICAHNKGWISLDGMIAKPKKEGPGRFIRIGGVKAWLGIHFGAWARHCDTPLWLVFDQHEEPRLANVIPSAHEVESTGGRKHCIPIDVPATAEHDEVLNSVVGSLKSIADQLKDANA